MTPAQVRELTQGGLMDVFDRALRSRRPLDVLLQEREARPDDVTLCVEIAAFYGRTREDEKAIRYLTLTTTIDPENPDTYCAVASYLFGAAVRAQGATELAHAADGLAFADKALALRP